jgi:glycosyltransferase involved in cell wall biosynthesis
VTSARSRLEELGRPPRSIALLSESCALGGGERVVAHLVDYWKQQGSSVHLIVPDREVDGWLAKIAGDLGCGVHGVPLTTTGILSSIAAVARLFRSLRIDIAHAHMFGMVGVAAIAGKISSTPVVATLHNGNEAWSLFKRRLPLALALRISAAITVVSKEMADQTAAAVWLTRDDFELVYNGAEAHNIERLDARRILELDENDFVILCLGTRTANKDHSTAIRAAARLSDARRVHVVIAGRDGDGSLALSDAIAAANIQVSCLGHRSDTGTLLSAADVLVHPSLKEGLPMVIVEAMLAGTPVVASDVGGIPEVIHDFRSGRLFRPRDDVQLADILASMMVDPSTAKRFALDAQEFAHEFLSVQAMGDKYAALISRILRSNDG